MKKDIRILLVDDQEVIRHGLQQMLAQEEDIEIIGQSANGEEAMSQAEILSPNVILMDVRMPVVDGLEATRRLREQGVPCDVIMLSHYEDYLDEALQAGVRGYLLKDTRGAELAEAIRQVYRGEVVISESIASNRSIEYEKICARKADGSIEEVQLVILPTADGARLLRFFSQVEELFQSRIVQMVGSWKGGCAVTISLTKPTPLESILSKLGEMSEVEATQGKPFEEGRSLRLVRKATALPRLKTRFSKTIFVTLKSSQTGECIKNG